MFLYLTIRGFVSSDFGYFFVCWSPWHFGGGGDGLQSVYQLFPILQFDKINRLKAPLLFESTNFECGRES